MGCRNARRAVAYGMEHITLNPVKGRKRSGYDRGNDTECWPWRGSFDPAGYGQAWNRRLKRLDKAHRVVYEYLTGNIAPPRGSGYELHHTCGHRWCVNPTHLERTTVSENRLGSNRHPAPKRKSIVELEHGKLSSYTRGCRCPECKAASKEYAREYRARRKAAGVKERQKVGRNHGLY